MYWVGLIMIVLQLFTMKYLKEDLYPIPKKVRFTYIVRCVIGMGGNLLYLLSLRFISVSKASVIAWTNPVFTAVMARYYLNERLSNYDWAAVYIAFFGILMI